MATGEFGSHHQQSWHCTMAAFSTVLELNMLHTAHLTDRCNWETTSPWKADHFSATRVCPRKDINASQKLFFQAVWHLAKAVFHFLFIFLLVFKHLVITQSTHALCIEWVSFSMKQKKTLHCLCSCCCSCLPPVNLLFLILQRLIDATIYSTTLHHLWFSNICECSNNKIYTNYNGNIYACSHFCFTGGDDYY